MAKSWHVIAEYKYRDNKITCVCQWQGDATEGWSEHKRLTKDDPRPPGWKRPIFPFDPKDRLGIKLKEI